MITTVALNPAVDKIYFIEDFKSGKMFRAGEPVKSAGGKGINVARVVKILDEKVLTTGFKGGQEGDWIENQMTDLGVSVNFVEVKGETRTNINIIDKKNKTETEILEKGFSVTSKDLDKFLINFNEIIKCTEVLVLSGGLPNGCPKDFYALIIENAKQENIPVILDTSGEVLKEGAKAKPYMIKPNIRELQILAAKKIDTVDLILKVCGEIIADGIKVVIVSLGEKGAVLVTEKEAFLAEVPDIEVINTVGSGDSLVAGFATGLKKGYSLKEALRLAMACGVNNAQYINVGMVDRQEVYELTKGINIKKLST
ncbi:1-phosphofructokinase [Herbivorax sp. ANBcel31]|uniref:1-phosphofructokinase n=1 Tax=Herbivorax sp. ANBcel31 TaxID=3069754 RepID=UPI0027B29677|nr:1-phosphofructokinase [Herbivorax sp. ANBcel31]MDQ2084962.1 1-phosphofructokinase [Herbivorax sp. ANBcel31]